MHFETQEEFKPRRRGDAPQYDVRRQTISQIRSQLENLPAGFPPVMIAGEPVMLVDGFRYVEEDGRRLGWASTILLAGVIILCFRSLRWVIIPVAVVQFALLLTKATLVWGNLQLSMVSSMLTAIVTVIGVAGVIHVLVHYREERQNGLDKRAALTTAGALLAMPVFWSCCTDAVGFISLLVTNVGPVQDFGVMMAIGAMLVLVSVILLIPGMALIKLPGPLASLDHDPQSAWREQTLHTALGRMTNLVERRPVLLGICTLFVIVTATAGVARVEVESDFTKNFRQGSPIVRSYNFIESNLGGAGVWDVLLPAPEELDWDYLDRVLEFEDRLRNEVQLKNAQGQSVPGLTKVISIADLVVASSPIHPETLLEEMKIPLVGRVIHPRQEAVNRSIGVMRDTLPVFMDALHAQNPDNEGEYYFRVMLRARERQSSADKRSLIEQVRQISEDEQYAWNREAQGAEVTGFFVLLTNLIDSLMADQWLAFGVAATGIGCMMLVAMILSDADLRRCVREFDLVSLVRILLRSMMTAAIMLVPKRHADPDGDGFDGLVVHQNQHGGGNDRGGVHGTVRR